MFKEYILKCTVNMCHKVNSLQRGTCSQWTILPISPLEVVYRRLIELTGSQAQKVQGLRSYTDIFTPFCHDPVLSEVYELRSLLG